MWMLTWTSAQLLTPSSPNRRQAHWDPWALGSTASPVTAAQQHMHVLWETWRAHLPPPLLPPPLLPPITFYRGSPWVVLRLEGCEQRGEESREIPGSSLPSIQDVGLKCWGAGATNAVKDSLHPHKGLFSLLASTQTFCSIG